MVVGRLLLLSLLLAGCVAQLSCPDWNYKKDDTDKGPSAWADNFPTCKGDRNSPIDLPLYPSYLYSFRKMAEPWRLDGWQESRDYNAVFSPLCITLTLDNFGEVKTSGGMLGGTYKLVQFHFHWGSSLSIGSEHTVEGTSYPMEMHIVHIKDEYSSIDDAKASGEKDAFAVFGFFIEASNSEEANAEVQEVLTKVMDDQMITISVNLLDLVKPSICSDYWRYEGGLTTPECNEQVIWTVFEKPIKANSDTLMFFNTVDDGNCGPDKFRPVQPRNDRKITKFRQRKSICSRFSPCGTYRFCRFSRYNRFTRKFPYSYRSKRY